MSKPGHVYLCHPCARMVGLQETFLLLLYNHACEGCGSPIGHDRATGLQIAPCMQMWRNKMWPVAFGIAIQDFAGAHVHDWSTTYWNGSTGERRENCRCGERRSTSPTTPTGGKRTG